MSGPRQSLAGVRVIDLGHMYQGPYATLLMALAGAEVIKVEPLAGERMRHLRGHDPSLAFATMNANKQGVTLDLSQQRGRALLIELAKCCDVLVENFAPGVAERLGIGAHVVRKQNPRLVYASGSGYGATGPDRDQLALDLTVQAMSGLMSMTGRPEDPPLRAGGASWRTSSEASTSTARS